MNRPRLLLHICCAPDEAWVVKTMKDNYHLHCFFSNPNITDRDEYVLRCREARKVTEFYNVEFSEDDYKPVLWEQSVAEALFTSEGGERCRRCFYLRLSRTASFCSSIGWCDFTTVMSISPHKNIKDLNAIGTECAEQKGLNYHCYDFKKKDGFRNSIILSKELNLYRQDYCGCRLSKAESEARKSAKVQMTSQVI
jgi:predicted adenine nucleotide alpha hydrolase (AANH) superfamily ATPase